MVMPASAAASRSGSGSPPALVGPSPETSMIWRVPSNGLSLAREPERVGNRGLANQHAPHGVDLRRQRWG